MCLNLFALLFTIIMLHFELWMAGGGLGYINTMEGWVR